LLELGVPREKIELHHHDVDGRAAAFMDWPITSAYCQKVADELDIPLFFSWKQGGFLGEMMRKDQPTAEIAYEIPGPDGRADPEVRRSGGNGPSNTRRKFPQVSGDLRVRWCSAYLKIDVMAAVIRGQERFNNARALVITGERADESPGRARYNTFEPHRADLRNGAKARHVDAWRPVHGWSEGSVWEIIARHGIVPHPAYQIGWGRLSCMTCIFGSDHQWASVGAVAPERLETIAAYERAFETTIHRTKPVTARAEAGTPYRAISDNTAMAQLAMSEEWTGPIRIDPAAWTHPAGAFGEACGPT
jgi:hypothetical protein